MAEIGHIYIIHALKGYEGHQARLQEILPFTGIDFTFVTDGDPALWTEVLIDKYFDKHIKSTLRTGVLSCTLNHILSYEKMLEAGLEYGLFFENDPFFLGGIEGFRPKVDSLLLEAEELEPGFIISLENTTLRFPKRSRLKKGQKLYAATQGRAAGAYIVDRVGIERMLADLKSKPCDTVIDWWHNDMIDRGVIKMYWAHPVLTEQGSHNGKLNAGISSKNASVFRQLKWKVQKAYKQLLHRIR